ncbi:hypothetical protein F5Y11DRAFT_364349 [Daldinia sp. FL1419]|nr:hypothetical protein F5Y11DRAFT_364349 [Daldinia sp. FL1419]
MSQYQPDPAIVQSLDRFLNDISILQEKDKHQQLRKVHRALVDTHTIVDDLDLQHISTLTRHALFQSIDRNHQLLYVDHLFSFLRSDPGRQYFGAVAEWDALFLLPLLANFILTTQPGGGYTSTEVNWFAWLSVNGTVVQYQSQQRGT